MKKRVPSPKKKRIRPLPLLAFFSGRVTLSGDAKDAPEILSICMQYALVYDDFFLEPNGRITLTASYSAAAKLREICRRSGLSLSVERREGILEVLHFCLLRPGIPIGAVLAILLTLVASTHLWEIRVTGNVSLSKREVIRELSDAGLSLGSRVSSIDVDSIENRLLINSDRISWITVNLMGTVAEVQIREKLIVDPPDPDSSPANLVARCDGVITDCEVLRGNALVKVGSVVRKGEVLVSGLYDSKILGYRYTRAKGEIYAETEHVFRVEVPYSYEKRSYTGELGKHYTLLFFGKEISLFDTGDFTKTESCVERISYLSVFGKDLPIGMRCETAYREELVPGTYTAERAMEIAYYRLSEEIASIDGMRGLLEKSVSAEVRDDAYVLNCKVRCIENIAETKNIEIVLFE